jgi:hypothetical protein
MLDTAARLLKCVNRMELAKLVLLCVVSLCGYGGLIGSASALLCPEAFTLGRPQVFEHWPPIALGAIWGALDLLVPAVAAGMALAIAANVGPRPALKAAFFRRIVPGLLGILTAASVAGGAAGFLATRYGLQTFAGPMTRALPADRHPFFAAVWWASLSALLALFATSVILAAWTWRKRAYFEELLRTR